MTDERQPARDERWALEIFVGHLSDARAGRASSDGRGSSDRERPVLAEVAGHPEPFGRGLVEQEDGVGHALERVVVVVVLP